MCAVVLIRTSLINGKFSRESPGKEGGREKSDIPNPKRWPVRLNAHESQKIAEAFRRLSKAQITLVATPQ